MYECHHICRCYESPYCPYCGKRIRMNPYSWPWYYEEYINYPIKRSPVKEKPFLNVKHQKFSDAVNRAREFLEG